MNDIKIVIDVAEKQNRKIYYSMGEVAEMFDVNQSLIRYWESKFDILRPKKNKKGNRMFRPEDVENLKIIYHLVKECGMTLEGAKRAMRSRGREDVSRSAELMERLLSVKSMLTEIRDMLREDDSDGTAVTVADYDAAAMAVERSDEPDSSSDAVSYGQFDDEQAVEMTEEPAVETVEEQVVEIAGEQAVESAGEESLLSAAEPVQEAEAEADAEADTETEAEAEAEAVAPAAAVDGELFGADVPQNAGRGGVTVIEPHEKKKPATDNTRRAERPFYEQTLF